MGEGERYETKLSNKSKRFSLNHISEAKNETFEKDDLFVPPIKIQTQLKRLIQYHSKKIEYKSRDYEGINRFKESQEK